MDLLIANGLFSLPSPSLPRCFLSLWALSGVGFPVGRALLRPRALSPPRDELPLLASREQPLLTSVREQEVRRATLQHVPGKARASLVFANCLMHVVGRLMRTPICP